MKQPAISVIIPIYNGADLLEDAVRSILAQSFTNFELLLINDGSTDDSLTRLHSFRDPRIRIIDQENIGLAATLNKGISLANAALIARLDQDDIAEPLRLARQLKALREHQLDAVFTQIIKFGSKNTWRNSEKQRESPGSVILLKPMEYGCFVQSTLLAKKSVLELLPYRAAYYPCDDWDLQLRLEEGYPAGLLEEKLIRYRFHDAANTYPTFFLMQEKRRWCEHNSFQRQVGKPELSFEAYQAQQTSRFKKWNRRRKDLYFFHIRIGGENYLHARYLQAMRHFMTGALLSPKKFIQRITGNVR